MEVELIDDKGTTTSRWISFEDWQRLKIWRHYKELMLANFGPYRTRTDEEIELFNEFYSKEYPENYKLLNLGDGTI